MFNTYLAPNVLHNNFFSIIYSCCSSVKYNIVKAFSPTQVKINNLSIPLYHDLGCCTLYSRVKHLILALLLIVPVLNVITVLFLRCWNKPISDDLMELYVHNEIVNFLKKGKNDKSYHATLLEEVQKGLNKYISGYRNKYDNKKIENIIKESWQKYTLSIFLNALPKNETTAELIWQRFSETFSNSNLDILGYGSETDFVVKNPGFFPAIEVEEDRIEPKLKQIIDCFLNDYFALDYIEKNAINYVQYCIDALENRLGKINQEALNEYQQMIIRCFNKKLKQFVVQETQQLAESQYDLIDGSNLNNVIENAKEYAGYNADVEEKTIKIFYKKFRNDLTSLVEKFDKQEFNTLYEAVKDFIIFKYREIYGNTFSFTATQILEIVLKNKFISLISSIATGEIQFAENQSLYDFFKDKYGDLGENFEKILVTSYFETKKSSIEELIEELISEANSQKDPDQRCLSARLRQQFCLDMKGVDATHSERFDKQCSNHFINTLICKILENSFNINKTKSITLTMQLEPYIKCYDPDYKINELDILNLFMNQLIYRFYSKEVDGEKTTFYEFLDQLLDENSEHKQRLYEFVRQNLIDFNFNRHMNNFQVTLNVVILKICQKNGLMKE